MAPATDLTADSTTRGERSHGPEPRAALKVLVVGLRGLEPPRGSVGLSVNTPSVEFSLGDAVLHRTKVVVTCHIRIWSLNH